MINVPGSDASFPANVRLPATGDAPTPTVLGAQGQDLADRTAWLKANTPTVQVTRYTSGSGVYLVPDGCIHLRWVVVGGGRGGSNGGAAQGGNGGQAGEIVEGEYVDGTIPATFFYQVGAAGASNAAGGHSYIVENTITIAFAAGGGSTPTGAPSEISFQGSMPAGAAGGLGGSGAVGAQGTTSRYASGGAGGSNLSGGQCGTGGYGYGAGGGGGRHASSTASGGGGGAGGYGRQQLAGTEAHSSSGRTGAPGLVMFIATVPGI